MPHFFRLILLLLPGLIGLGWYCSHADLLDDVRIYYEMAGQTLGRPYNAEYLAWKRSDEAPFPSEQRVTAPAGRIWRDFVCEYPPLALGLFVGPRLFTDDMVVYFHCFQALMAAAVAGAGIMLACLLADRGGGLERAALLTSLLIVLSGPYLVNRFDAAVALTAGAAVVAALNGRPTVAGLCLGTGAALKLWPIVLLPWLLLALRSARGVSRLLLGVALIPLLSHLLPALWVGPSVLNYLRFHQSRGLQLETLYASILAPLAKGMKMTASSFRAFGSSNLETPFTSVALWGATFAFPLCYVGLLAYAWRRRAAETPSCLLAALTGVVLLLIVTAKVLSPQYLIWLFPLALALPGRRGTMLATLYLLAVALTHVYYPGVPGLPLSYTSLEALTWPAMLVLLARNLALLAATALAWRLALAREAGRPEIHVYAHHLA